jgi:hypothetical protein
MITISQLTELLGWSSLINLAYLLLATSIIKFNRGWISSIHIKLFALDETELKSKYFDFLSIYKIVTLSFFVAPYAALKIMGH